MITLELLQAVCPHVRRDRLLIFLEPLGAAMTEFEIDTPAREAHFLAQIAHESGELRYVTELASGDDYEGSTRLGNTEPGDGRRFKGRGLIQITGRKNYRLCGDALGFDLLGDPELLTQPVHAARSAAWFWRVGAGLNLSRVAHEHGLQDGCDLNDLADVDDLVGITIAINGGRNGIDDRAAHLKFAKEALA